jgi:hypothetical protein
MSPLRRLLLSIVVVAAGFALIPVQGADPKRPDNAAIERARTTVKILDDAYKAAVISVTEHYVEQQQDTPAAVVAKDVFKHMKAKGWHGGRLIDATGKPKNKENLPKSDFEKTAVEKMKAGAQYYDEVAEVEGKPVLQAATIVPVVLKQCATCHGKKEGTLLGAIIYELPIK